MSREDIGLHQRLEAALDHLRLLRLLRSEVYNAEKEDAVLDEMEATWLRMSDAERLRLEELREAGTLAPGTPMVDVDPELMVRGGLPPRVVDVSGLL